MGAVNDDEISLAGRELGVALPQLMVRQRFSF
jgi:hypothetical protein